MLRRGKQGESLRRSGPGAAPDPANDCAITLDPGAVEERNVVLRMPEDDPALSLESKTGALMHALKEKFGMADEDAEAIASVVAEQFGAMKEVNDDNLDPEVRSIFYTLEAKKLLSFRREEYTWENGERRRGFYWRVRDEELARIAEAADATVTGDEDVYATLPRDVWSRRAA